MGTLDFSPAGWPEVELELTGLWLGGSGFWIWGSRGMLGVIYMYFLLEMLFVVVVLRLLCSCGVTGSVTGLVLATGVGRLYGSFDRIR